MNIHTLFRLARRLANHKRLRLATIGVVGLFVLSNLVLLATYNNRTYPNTTVGGKKLGSVSARSLPEKLEALALLPKEVAFRQDKTIAKAALASLGVGIDYQRLADKTLHQRSWLPIANLWQTQTVGLVLKQDQSKLQTAMSAALTSFQRQPSDARIARQNDSFVIQPEVAGQTVDLNTTRQRLVSSLSSGTGNIPVATKSVAAAITSAQLRDELESLNKQSKVAITLQYNGQSKRLSSAEIAAFYSQDKSHMVLSDAAILTAVNTSGAAWGIVVDNQAAAQAAIKSALQNQKDVTIGLVAAPKAIKTIRYCTSVRGVSEAVLPELNAKLQATLADSRGWSVNGLIRFEKSEAGCEMRVWLSAADQMPSFGAICDSAWSCAVHPNVVINYDRWRYASDAWNQQNGSLDDYRSMVINHESGHWFGFNHSYCSGAGQPAPVMQQQSINLQGCTFNPWPTAGEQAGLKQRLGL
jgi:hypothetical protein